MDKPTVSPRLIALLCVLLGANLAVMSWLAFEGWRGQRDRFLVAADAYLATGRMEEAMRSIDLHLQQHPQDGEAAQRREELEAVYRSELLKEARARLDTDDRAGAVAAFKQYLERAPDDFAVRLELGELYQKLGAEEEAERLFRQVADGAARGAAPGTVATARDRLFKLVNARANALKRRADTLAGQSKFEAALPLYDQVIALRARNPALETRTPDRLMAVQAFDAAVAKRAFVASRAGVAGNAADELTSRYDERLAPPDRAPGAFLLQRQQSRRTMLSDLYWELGDAHFEEEQWEAAEEAYVKAVNIRPERRGPGHDLDAAALQYNLAFSAFRAGRPQAALERLDRLASEVPEYDRINVNTLRKQILEKLGGKAPVTGHNNDAP